jgi:outer membrane protein TolC
MSRSAFPMLFLVPAFAGCVAYDPLDADLTKVAAEVRQRPGGAFTFGAAVLLAMRQNSDVRAAAARLRAAQAVTVPVEVQAEWTSDDDMLAVMVDPFALLGSGPRGGALDVAEAEAARAAQELATVRWQAISAIAEAFLVEEALSVLTVPAIEVDAAAFERAGLASRVAAMKVRAAQARASAEQAELATARAQNRDTLRRLLGLASGAPIETVRGEAGWLRQPEGSEASVLQRPDLTLSLSRLQLAEAGFRAAVRDQYPSLMVGPDVPLSGGSVPAMAVLRLPVGMHGRAAAARERRDAAHAELTAAFVQASTEASSSEMALATAIEARAGLEATRVATEEALRVALVGLRVDPDAFDQLAESAAMAVREAQEHRMAVVALARARVRRAVAFGWPAQAGERP